MSGPEDVLDVMHDCAERLRTKGCFSFAAELDAARSTVAELIEAADQSVDAMWIIDSHEVRFDPTVVFSQYYDFSGLYGAFREEFLAEYSCIVWPSGGKWSAYCTYEGALWFERFDTAGEAKEQCMKLLDAVLSSHPAMRLRAALARCRGVA